MVEGKVGRLAMEIWAATMAGGEVKEEGGNEVEMGEVAGDVLLEVERGSGWEERA